LSSFSRAAIVMGIAARDGLAHFGLLLVV